MNQAKIYSVSQLNQSVRQMLEGQLGLVWLTGEISNFTQPVSGHWYLTLKDENAQVRCAMFRMKNMRVNFKAQNGMQVLVRASVSLYEPRGDYQLIIESMHPAGEGLLQQQFEALKLKLAAEGLFAQNLKKNLPHFAKTVGIVTSPTGAALQDILHILQRRDPSLKVVIYPTAVQGKEATAEIVQMIELANQRREVDVLIVGRGGGSLEDLWCFNEEIIARAIFNSQLPVISAVGHETDVTIADFVADLRAPTPSAAAELVSRNQQELIDQLVYRQQRLEMALDRLFQQKVQLLQRLQFRLQQQHPQSQLNIQQQKVQQLSHRLHLALATFMDKRQQKMTALCRRLENSPLPYYVQKQQQSLAQLEIRLNIGLQNKLKNADYQLSRLCGKLDSLSPLKVLSRGYSITENEKGHALKDSHQIETGQLIKTQLERGVIISRVEQVEH
ncbi:exodeoxyribonuclease VII large subunit [Haemophilus haemoglobinophilus]|nr:exodeoxyribonuclease VII large subunit [Canicola haemoglobinophilus]